MTRDHAYIVVREQLAGCAATRKDADRWSFPLLTIQQIEDLWNWAVGGGGKSGLLAPVISYDIKEPLMTC
jgi:hypothetical protein